MSRTCTYINECEAFRRFIIFEERVSRDAMLYCISLYKRQRFITKGEASASRNCLVVVKVSMSPTLFVYSGLLKNKTSKPRRRFQSLFFSPFASIVTPTMYEAEENPMNEADFRGNLLKECLCSSEVQRFYGRDSTMEDSWVMYTVLLDESSVMIDDHTMMLEHLFNQYQETMYSFLFCTTHTTSPCISGSPFESSPTEERRILRSRSYMDLSSIDDI